MWKKRIIALALLSLWVTNSYTHPPSVPEPNIPIDALLPDDILIGKSIPAQPFTYEVKPHRQTLILTANGNIRKEPSVKHAVIKTFPKSTKLEAFKRTTIDGKVWYKVSVGKTNGWVSSSIVKAVTVSTKPSPSPASKKPYPVIPIQSYKTTIVNGNLLISGKPTAYGEYKKATGIIINIYEYRTNQHKTIKIPFLNGSLVYKYKPTYPVGKIILNLDEYYEGIEDDPNQVLGSATFELTDGNPYLTGSYMVESDHPTIIGLAKKITSGKKTDTEKSRAIFEWVSKNIRYDTKTYFGSKDNWKYYTALETFKTRLAMCTGYAHLNASLHRSIGIQAKVVHGEEHAWNEILLNGKWQTQDPTFGAGFVEEQTNKFVPRYQSEYFTKTEKKKEGEMEW